MSAEMERLIAEFEKFQSKIKNAEQQFGNVAQLQEELGTLEAVAVSPDRTIRVVAGPGGAVKDIQLSGEALRQQPGALSAAIMSTLQRAVADAARKQAGIVDQHMGGVLGGLSVTDQVLQNQADAFGTTVEDLKAQTAEGPAPTPPPAPAPPPPAPATPRRPQPPAYDEDDDYEGFGSVFEDNGGGHR